jgi:hypothetical protein
MGKLAERLADPARAGVYRVETTEALEEAAALNRYRLERIALDGAAQPLLDRLAGKESSGRVLLVSGFERLFRERPEEGERLLAELRERAPGWRERAERVFVAFVDPGRALGSLAPLYNWDRKRS